MCNDTFVAQVATFEVVPIVFCILRAWKETQTSTLNRRANVRARGRDPDVTGAPDASRFLYVAATPEAVARVCLPFRLDGSALK